MRSALGSLLVLTVFSIGCGLCGDELVSTAESPGGRFTAIVSVRNCGATTSYVTWVSVARGGARRPGSGQLVFTADSGRGAAESWPSGGPVVRVRWRSEDLLEVAYDSKARVGRSEKRAGTVTVTFVPSASGV